VSKPDIKAGRAFVELYLKNTLTRGLQQARKQLDAFGTSAINLGRQLVTMGTMAAAPFALATKTFMDFDDAMRAVQGVTSANEKQFEALTNKAKQLGASTSFTATQVAGLMVELGRAGFVPEEIDAMTAAVLNLSRATGTDATMSAGIMAASIRQFGLAAGDSTRVADSLTAAANKSFNTVEALGEALSYAGPVAADFNMSIEDTLAVLGALGNVGIQGSNAGTAVRRLLTLGAAEADKLKGIFGVAFTDAAGNARPLVDVLDEVNQATANLGTAERAKKFNEAFGLLGITGASAISKNAVSVRELQKAIKGAGGIADETAKKMDGGLGGAFRRMMSAVEGVLISVGESLAPILSRYADVLEKASQLTIELVKNNGDFIVSAAKVVMKVVAIGAALIAAGVAVKALAFSFGVIFSPGGLLLAGVIAWAKWSKSGQDSMTAIGEVARSVFGAITDAWGGITDAMKAGDMELAGQIAMNGLEVAFYKGTNAIYKTFLDVKLAIMSTWQELHTELAKTFTNWYASIQIGWVNLISFLQESFAKAKNFIQDANDLFSAGIEFQVNDQRLAKGLITAEEHAAVKEEIKTRTLGNINQRQGEVDDITSRRDSELRDIRESQQRELDRFDAENNAKQNMLNRDYEAGLSGRQGAQADAEARLNEHRLDAFWESVHADLARDKQKIDEAAAGVPGALGSAARGGSSAGSFSGAALAAMGMGTRDPIVDAIERGHKIDEKMLEADEKMVQHFERGGLLQVVGS
jgi:TP901 family phage tail tape measure protein